MLRGLFFLFAGSLASLVHAAGTVTICDDAHLATALAGGGAVTFNCGGPATLAITAKTIAADTSIDGANNGFGIILDGGGTTQLFSVGVGASLTLRNLTLTRGKVVSHGTGGGGAVKVIAGTLIADNVTFSENMAGEGGGAVYALSCNAGPCPTPTVTITNSRFAGNTTGGAQGTAGGAIFVGDTKLNVSGTTFTGNSSLYGGAIAVYGGSDATITDNTFSGNWSQGNNFSQGHGGAIAVENASALKIANSTFNGNEARLNTDSSATRGGAIFLWSPPNGAVLNNLTVAGNTASGVGGGVYFSRASTTLRNSIVASNTGGNCGSTAGFVNGGNNLQFGDATCAGAAVADPRLGALAGNGGSTRTMALGAGSPAIDAGNDATCAETDQRGVGRPQGAACDIGAYEAVAVPAAASYQGLWWASPAASESGWGINFAHQGKIIFATWFTYDAAGKPWWLIAELHRSAAGTFTGPVSTVAGPPFNAVPFAPAPVETTVGTMTATFSDAAHGSLAYTVNGLSQTKAIVPQQFGQLPTCAWGAQPDLALATNYTDLWWNSGESGWGINFAHQGDIIFATWFTYDASGKPWWLIAELHRSAAGVYSGGVSTVVGSPFNAVPFDSSKVVETPAGTATVTIANGNAATFAYTVNGTSRSKAITRQVFVPPGTVCQ
jgi:predicted outer membrane repeat protein